MVKRGAELGKEKFVIRSHGALPNQGVGCPVQSSTLEEADDEADPGTVGRVAPGLVTEDQGDLEQEPSALIEAPREELRRSEEGLRGKGTCNLGHGNQGW